MAIRFDGQVAVVTGSGHGLGRSHALELARRGAKVVVNDLGGSTSGEGSSSDAARAVVEEIQSQGGEAIANGADVTIYEDVSAMVETAVSRWGRVDVLINNAGILRDKTFAKDTLQDFQAVVDVHLGGTINCTKACWQLMREQSYGRIVVTTSNSGLYGNFGQCNYSAAKTGVIGFMNTLGLEGAKCNIRVNALSPVAGTRMTEGLMGDAAFETFSPESVTPAAVYLASAKAPDRTILSAGGGVFSVTKLVETEGVWLPTDQHSAEAIEAHWSTIFADENHSIPRSGPELLAKFNRLISSGLGRPFG